MPAARTKGDGVRRCRILCRCRPGLTSGRPGRRSGGGLNEGARRWLLVRRADMNAGQVDCRSTCLNAVGSHVIAPSILNRHECGVKRGQTRRERWSSSLNAKRRCVFQAGGRSVSRLECGRKLSCPVRSALNRQECGAELADTVGEGFWTWAHGVGGLRGGGPDTRRPPLCLVPVCWTSDIRTGRDIFGDQRWMAKNVRRVRSVHLGVIW